MPGGLSIRPFRSIDEAQAWYAGRVEAEGLDEDRILLAICRGEHDAAQSRLRATRFPSRWRANVVYATAHYLLYLGRRDRLRAALTQADPRFDAGEPLEDPWLDLRSIATRLDAGVGQDSPLRAERLFLLGHAYLSMEYHEAAESAYRRALLAGRERVVPWDNLRLLEPLAREAAATVDTDPGSP